MAGSRPPTGAPLEQALRGRRRRCVTTGRSASNWPSCGSLPCQSARPKPPSAGPLRPIASSPGGASLDHEPALGSAGRSARRAAGPVARSAPAVWAAPALGQVLHQMARRSGNSRIGPCCALPGGAVPISADATTRRRRAARRAQGEGRITLDQRGKVSSGRTRSTRAVGGGFPRSPNTVPPSTSTSSTMRKRLIVDIGLSAVRVSPAKGLPPAGIAAICQCVTQFQRPVKSPDH